MKSEQKILWVNPGFLDYRVPLYKEIGEQTKGSFHLIYGASRMPERVCKKVNETLKQNAHPITSNYLYRFGKNRSAKEGHSQSLGYANDSVEVLIPKGLYKKIRSVSPDIIIAEGFFKYTPWALIYSILHRKPLYIYYERTLHTERSAPWWRKSYRKFVSMFTKGFLVNGEETKKLLKTWGISEKRIFTGGMSADSNGLKNEVSAISQDQIEELKNAIIGKIPDNGLIYVYTGQLIKRKGIEELIKGWAIHSKKHPEDRLMIVGSGDQESRLKSMASVLPSVIFTGGIDYSEIYKYYAISDVFIIPTLEDNWSLVVPEAMACGLPIACSIYNGCHTDLVKKDINGISFDPLNVEDVSNTLDYFHHQDLSEMGKQSVWIESNFNPSHAANNILKAFEK